MAALVCGAGRGSGSDGVCDGGVGVDVRVGGIGGCFGGALSLGAVVRLAVGVGVDVPIGVDGGGAAVSCWFGSWC